MSRVRESEKRRMAMKASDQAAWNTFTEEQRTHERGEAALSVLADAALRVLLSCSSNREPILGRTQMVVEDGPIGDDFPSTRERSIKD